jgi:hypothetical protein
VLIDDEHITVAIRASEERNGVVRKPVVERDEPLPAAQVVKLVNDVRLAPERREELAGGDVPVTIEPLRVAKTPSSREVIDSRGFT